MNIVDYIFLGFLVFYFWRGWSKGLFRSILGPVALFVCVGYAYFYYQRTHNFLLSLGIGLLGPLVINIAAIFLLMIFKKADGKKEEDDDPHEVKKRFFGGVLNASWMMFLMLVSMISLAMVPFKMPGFEELRKVIVESSTMMLVSAIAGDRLPILKKGELPIDIANDPFYFKKLQNLPEYTQLMENPRVKNVLSNEKVKKMIEDKDIVGLLSSPKMHEIMQDPKLIQEFLKINQKIGKMKQESIERNANVDDIHENY